MVHHANPTNRSTPSAFSPPPALMALSAFLEDKSLLVLELQRAKGTEKEPDLCG